MDKSLTVAICFTLLTALGCQAEMKLQSSRAFIFYTEPTPTGCQWHLLDPHANEKRLVYETPKCPSKIIWDSRGHQTFYTLDESSGAIIYRVSWYDQKPPESLGPRGDLVDLWISRDSGRLRRVSFIETIAENTLSEGATTYFLYKGRRYPTEDVAGDGIIGMAVVEEQKDSHAWSLVGAHSTNWGAGDSMGTFVVESLMEKDPMTVTLLDLLQRATCAAQGCPSDMSQAPPAMKDRIKTLFPGLGSREGDGLVYEPLNAQEGILFATGMGDTVHAGGPVYHCLHQCQETKRWVPAGDFSQLSVSTQAACALLTEEYTGDNASIICSGQSVSPLILKESQSAVWFPFVELWSIARSTTGKAS